MLKLIKDELRQDSETRLYEVNARKQQNTDLSTKIDDLYSERNEQVISKSLLLSLLL